MNKPPPFRFIAVSGLARDAQPVSEALLSRWIDQAISRGADALLIREKKVAVAKVVELIEWANAHPARKRFTLMAYLEAAGLDGLHADSMTDLPPREGLLRGKSCHTAVDVTAAQDYDYIFLSPVFSTRTHPDAAPLGLERLREICAQSSTPIYALGGVTESNYRQCLEAGAYGMAAIGWFAY